MAKTISSCNRSKSLDSTYSSKFKHAHAMTHSTQSSFPSPSVCQTFFSSSVFPVTVIRVPPPFSGGFLLIFPNWRPDRLAQVCFVLASRTHLYTLRRDLMTCIREIEHCPEICVRVRFRDLVKRGIVRVDNFVDRRADTRVLNRPSKVTRCFAFDNAVSRCRVSRIRRLTWSCPVRREELCNA